MTPATTAVEMVVRADAAAKARVLTRLWSASRHSGMALVLSGSVAAGQNVHLDLLEAEMNHASRLDWQRRENAQRDLMTLEVCRIVAGALVNAMYIGAEREHRHASLRHQEAASDDSFPGYLFIRDYLAYECEARYPLACAVAFALAASDAASERRRILRDTPLYQFLLDRERGWM